MGLPYLRLLPATSTVGNLERRSALNLLSYEQATPRPKPGLSYQAARVGAASCGAERKMATWASAEYLVPKT